jgi:signal transduction histidine kinase
MSTGGLLLAALLVGFSIAALRRRAAELEAANRTVVALNVGLESRVAMRTEALAEANSEIRRFAYIVSHDLRSPLVNVMGFTAELDAVQAEAARLVSRVGAAAKASEREAILVDMPEALGFIRAASRRMDGLIKAILELSRAGRRPLTCEAVDLAALFARLAVTHRSQLDQAGAQLILGPLPVIRSDAFSLEQLFANLLDNAVKYLRPDTPGVISVSAEAGDRTVAVTVADNGRGIAAHDLERVFELFRRAGVQDRAGDGVGLAHVRALAHRLQGTVSVTSTVGEGSRFTVRLPYALETGDADEGSADGDEG